LAISAAGPLYDEPFRPQFHYSPPQWWMNDPNGLVYYDGEYHLFFQHNPQDVVWGPMHWGHAVTRDLIHWETLPIALSPDEHGTIFSGTVVVDAENISGLVPGGGLVAIYSYNTQTQGAAYSTDRGRTWTTYAGNPILSALRQDFRDPKIFWHEDRWIMAISAGQSIMFLQSPNLLTWEILSEFAGNYHGGVWEVPDLFPMDVDGTTKWVLIISVNPTAPAGGSGTRYFIGHFDGRVFTDESPDETLWLDWGADNYAGTIWNNAPDGRTLFLGWMNNWNYANEIPTSVWRGAMTIPRELELANTADGLRLIQRPIDALDLIRIPLNTWENLSIEGVTSLENVMGQTLEIEAEFELGDADVFGFDLCRTDEDSLQIAYNVQERQLVINRVGANLSGFNLAYPGPLDPIDQRIRLHLLIDHSSLEVFANDGLLSMTSQFFPTGDMGDVQVFSRGGTVKLISLKANTLKSIWKQD
jgi:fructan beta-fructosidase